MTNLPKHGLKVFWPCVAMLGGCAVSPGLYVDNVEVASHATAVPETLGGQYEVIPITAQTLRKTIADVPDEPVDPKPFERESYEYRIGPYDILSITVWEHPELQLAIEAANLINTEGLGARATGHRVDEQGNIFFPHAGVITAAGLTVGEFRTRLIQKLSRYVPNPQLDVQVSSYRSKKIYIVGSVEKRGALSLGDTPMRVLDAVNLMGGIKENADLRNATMVRKGKVYPVDFFRLYEQGDLTQNYLLEDGDVLRVPDNSLNVAYVMGEAKENKAVPIPSRGLTLAASISEAGGLDLKTVDAGRIFVFRRGNHDVERDTPTPRIFHLNASSAEAMLLATQFALKPLDVVYIAPRSIVRWNRLVATILPTLDLIWRPTRIYTDYKDIFDGDNNGSGNLQIDPNVFTEILNQ